MNTTIYFNLLTFYFNVYKLLNVFNIDRLGNIVNKDIRCRINKQNKITSISQLYLDEEEWIVCKEIDN